MPDTFEPGGPRGASISAATGLQTGPNRLDRASTAGPSTVSDPTEQQDQEFGGVAARTQSQMVFKRFVEHRLAMGSLTVFLLLALTSFIGTRLWRWDVAEATGEYSQPPSWAHPLGTTESSYDSLAQVLAGTQKTLQLALLVALISTVLGTAFGAIAGYYRGPLDQFIARLVDLVLTIPSLALLVVLGAIAARRFSGWFGIALVLGLVLWAPVARVVRSVVLSLREKEYVEAARALGASDFRIIVRHLLPNALGVIIVNATLAVAIAILTESALSYLGLGVQAPNVSLGKLISLYQGAAQTRPWLFYPPGFVIIAICLCVNFIGDGLRDAFDPSQKKVRA